MAQLGRDAPELDSGRLVPAGTKTFESSGSGRNWLENHGRNRNCALVEQLA